MEINSKTLISAISRTLKNNFPNYTIYKDKKKQGIKKPCFFIFQLNAEQEKVTKDIFKRDLLVNIRFFTDADRMEIDSVNFDLLSLLPTISYEGIRFDAKKISSEVQDDVLQLFLSYKIRVLKEKDIPNYMESIEIK